MGGDGVVDQRPRRAEIAPAPGRKQRLKDVPQHDRVGVSSPLSSSVARPTLPAQPVRDAEICVWRRLADELLATGTPFQHADHPPFPRFPSLAHRRRLQKR